MTHALSRLFDPAKWGKLDSRNRIKYGSCCVSNYNERDGTITLRELGRTQVIAATGCHTLVLVSCDPVSLARDARLLAGHGFAHEGSTVLDLFPHTPHVEVVTRFAR